MRGLTRSGHRLDCAALAGSVTSFEEDADPQALMHHPLLELDELDMQALEFALVVLSFQLAASFRLVFWVSVFSISVIEPSRRICLQPSPRNAMCRTSARSGLRTGFRSALSAHLPPFGAKQTPSRTPSGKRSGRLTSGCHP